VATGDRIEVRDAHTGRVVAAREGMTAPGTEVGISDAGARLAVGTIPVPSAHPPRSAIVLYPWDDLSPERGIKVNAPAGYYQTCSALLCGAGPLTGAVVIDEATGDPLWQNTELALMTFSGNQLVAVVPRAESTVSFVVVDRDTGRLAGEVRDWHWLQATDAPPGGIYVSREDRSGHTWLGVYDVRVRAVDGVADTGAFRAECAATGRYVICKVPDGVQVWRARSS
jgi:hypothetical protein